MATAKTEPPSLATGRGKLILGLLTAIAFLDFVDASIVNIALPSIRNDLSFSQQSLQWVPSAYLLTYGGFMLLGGRAADLLGRRRVLVAGISVSLCTRPPDPHLVSKLFDAEPQPAQAN